MAQKISDCCGAYATDPLMLDYGICPDCKDHCEFVDEVDKDDDFKTWNEAPYGNDEE